MRVIYICLDALWTTQSLYLFGCTLNNTITTWPLGRAWRGPAPTLPRYSGVWSIQQACERVTPGYVVCCSDWAYPRYVRWRTLRPHCQSLQAMTSRPDCAYIAVENYKWHARKQGSRNGSWRCSCNFVLVIYTRQHELFISVNMSANRYGNKYDCGRNSINNCEDQNIAR